GDARSFIYRRSSADGSWTRSPCSFPNGCGALTSAGLDAGLRFVDLDEDGHDDIVFSNAERYGVYLFNDMQTGWSRVVLEGTRAIREANGGREAPGGDKRDSAPQKQRDATPPAPPLRRGGAAGAQAGASGRREPAGRLPSQFEIPPIVRADGTDNGFF